MHAQPEIGSWYRVRGGDSFEVVAIDEDDGTIEVQYFDGTVEELEREDWDAQHSSGELTAVKAPEDWSGSIDIDSADEAPSPNSGYDGDSRPTGGFDDLDLFEGGERLR